MNNFSKRS